MGPPAGRKRTRVAEENIRAVRQLQERVARRRSAIERLSDAIASLAARDGVIVAHALWFVAWIAANAKLVRFIRPFDPFPFTLLTTLVSLEAIFLTLFVLASQNRLTQEADRRAHLDLQVNLLSEQEMTVVLRMLKEVCDHFALHNTTSSDTFQELVRRTDLNDLAERLDSQLSTSKEGPDRADPA
jgi:uncharacterized membrane protein